MPAYPLCPSVVNGLFDPGSPGGFALPSRSPFRVFRVFRPDSPEVGTAVDLFRLTLCAPLWPSVVNGLFDPGSPGGFALPSRSPFRVFRVFRPDSPEVGMAVELFRLTLCAPLWPSVVKGLFRFRSKAASLHRRAGALPFPPHSKTKTPAGFPVGVAIALGEELRAAAADRHHQRAQAQQAHRRRLRYRRRRDLLVGLHTGRQ